MTNEEIVAAVATILGVVGVVTIILLLSGQVMGQ